MTRREWTLVISTISICVSIFTIVMDGVILSMRFSSAEMYQSTTAPLESTEIPAEIPPLQPGAPTPDNPEGGCVDLPDVSPTWNDETRTWISWDCSPLQENQPPLPPKEYVPPAPPSEENASLPS